MASGIWKITRNRPFSTDRVLTGQIRRAGVSNIAEGFERGSRAEFGRFLKIAKGSCGEVRAQMLVASDLNYVSKRECEEFCSTVRQISAGLSNLNRYLTESAEQKRRPSSDPS
jgi:four helix bundle protein